MKAVLQICICLKEKKKKSVVEVTSSCSSAVRSLNATQDLLFNARETQRFKTLP